MEKSNKRQQTQADRSADFSNHALRGLQYLPKDEDLTSIISRINASVDANPRPQHPQQRIARRQSLSKLAAILILAALPLAYWFFTNEKKPYVAWSLPDHNLAARAGKTSARPSSKHLADGASAYQARNYKAAAAHFSSHLDFYPDDAEVRFYQALSLLGDKQYSPAAEVFSALLATQPPGAIADNARWFLAVAHLEGGNLQKAKPIFEALSRNSDNYKYEAAQALSRLPKL